MDAFDIVRLVSVYVALILGAIVFLVLFFRGMAWIDSWIKQRGYATCDAQSECARQSHLKKSAAKPAMVQAVQAVAAPSPKKTVVSIQLQCGQIVELVFLLPPIEAAKICEAMGLRYDNALGGCGDGGEFVIIREANIKMITIKSDCVPSIASVTSDLHIPATYQK